MTDLALGIIFTLVGLLGTIILSSIVRGYVFSTLWGWFMVPIFNLPPINIPLAIGIYLIIILVTSHLKTDYSNSSSSTQGFAEKVGESFGTIVLYPFFILFLGWIIHLFI